MILVLPQKLIQVKEDEYSVSILPRMFLLHGGSLLQYIFLDISWWIIYFGPICLITGGLIHHLVNDSSGLFTGSPPSNFDFWDSSPEADKEKFKLQNNDLFGTDGTNLKLTGE